MFAAVEFSNSIPPALYTNRQRQMDIPLKIMDTIHQHE